MLIVLFAPETPAVHVDEAVGGQLRFGSALADATLVSPSRALEYGYYISTQHQERGLAMAYFEGQLKRADTEPGEEHTGYVLETEIDMSAIQDVDELMGDQIAVTGDVEIVDFPERGKILVFKATSVAVLEEEVEDEDLSPA
jgi:hypothetical protein